MVLNSLFPNKQKLSESTDRQTSTHRHRDSLRVGCKHISVFERVCLWTISQCLNMSRWNCSRAARMHVCYFAERVFNNSNLNWIYITKPPNQREKFCNQMFICNLDPSVSKTESFSTKTCKTVGRRAILQTKPKIFIHKIKPNHYCKSIICSLIE